MALTQSPLQIYRQRLLPNECLLLKDDIVVEQNKETIITKWKTLNPKINFSHGCSCYFLKEGIKVSKFYRSDNTLLYWYCDIVDFNYIAETNTLTVTDLLADVILHPNGMVQVMDLDELALAFEQNLIEDHLLSACLKRLNSLLSTIYNNQFSIFQEKLNEKGL